MYESSLLGAGFGGVLGASIAYVVGNWAVWRRLRAIESEFGRLEQKVDSVGNYARGVRGNVAQAEQSQELQNAIAEALQIWQGEGSQEDKTKALMGLAMKYPAVRKIALERLGVRL